MEQLNKEELFLLDYINDNIDLLNNIDIKSQYINDNYIGVLNTQSV